MGDSDQLALPRDRGPDIMLDRELVEYVAARLEENTSLREIKAEIDLFGQGQSALHLIAAAGRLLREKGD